jgi:hypothetical protein
MMPILITRLSIESATLPSRPIRVHRPLHLILAVSFMQQKYRDLIRHFVGNQ